MTHDETRMTKARWCVLLALWLTLGALQAHEVTHSGTTVRVDGVTDAQWKSLEGMLKDQLTLSGTAAATEPLRMTWRSSHDSSSSVKAGLMPSWTGSWPRASSSSA